MQPSKAKQLVERYRSQLIDLTVALVKMPTENKVPSGTEARGQAVLQEFLAPLAGVSIDQFEPDAVEGAVAHPDWWPGRDYAGRPNLVATLPGAGNGRSLVFNGHMDTVTRAPLPWETGDPFSGLIRGNKLYGRGSYDMKAGVAACATVLKILADEAIALPGSVILQSVVDEENAGANGTLAAILRGHVGDLAIIPEPTNMEVCPHTRGGQVFNLIAKGQGGVAYGGETTVNPIVLLAEAIRRLQAYEDSINTRVHPGLFAGERHPRDLVVSKIAAGDEPGGNIGVPVVATAEFFIQTLPGMTEAELQSELRAALGDLLVQNGGAVELQPASRYLSGADTPVDHDGVAVLLSAYDDLSGRRHEPVGATFGGDGYLFNRYSAGPSLHFGPRGGNAHGPDEFVEIDSLTELTEVLLLTAIRWCS
ncbi:M20/M25/M40 family metallo-hydrolase [Mesorhizobium sp. BAC0120]|uniref:M20 family metallopeptidase n=1 Tax=Mesorhizobium sp. BAC0120 TaxID=3090670 RepID=UPI00298CA969|nr:M20/M25/M40 family metallo-hydrolase [Mesorhizobium sp. BAC0120]MDW6023657.1 M20/M25/M40 family metallo-hydrolase [Mesorhizobium sp. BAC0120]